MSTDLSRRLKEGADNIHSIGAGRVADLLREAADAFETARHDFGSTMRCEIAPMIGPGRVDGRLADEPAGQLEYCAAHKWQDAGWHAEGLLGRREADTNEDLTVTRRRLADLQEKVAMLIGVDVPQLNDPCGSGDIISALRVSLGCIDDAYRQRNAMVCVAARLLLNGHPESREWGYVAGIFNDPHAEPGFGTVVALDLAGQITFHMDERDPAKPWAALPPYRGEWDGHSDAVKWERVMAFLGSQPRREVLARLRRQVGQTQMRETTEDDSLRPYFVGPHLYIAEDEVEARAFHSDMVATSSLKLNDLRDVIAASNVDVEDGDRWDASLSIDALIRMLQDSGEMPILGDLDAEIVEFCEDTGWVKVSKRDAAEWCRRGKGNVGVLQSYYESKVKPHLDALTMLAVKVGSEVRP